MPRAVDPRQLLERYRDEPVPLGAFFGVDYGVGDSYTVVVIDEVSSLVNPRTVIPMVNVNGVWQRRSDGQHDDR